MIKILAIGRSLPHSFVDNCLRQNFPCYTSTQLNTIICLKFNCDRMTKSTSDYPAEEIVKSEFKAMCEQALPLFTMTTRRVDELWTLMKEMYVKRSHMSKLAAPSLDNENTNSTGIDPTTDCQTNSSNSGSKRSLDTEVYSLMQSPAVHMSSSQTVPVDLESRKLSQQIIQIFLIILLFDVVNGNQWFLHLPLRAKALALSAFLASRNPPASDRSTFGQATKGRRKKTRGDPTPKTAAGSQPQFFGVERLLSIYGQVLPSILGATECMTVNKYRKLRRGVSAGAVDKRVSIFSDGSLSRKHENTNNEAVLYSMVSFIGVIHAKQVFELISFCSGKNR